MSAPESWSLGYEIVGLEADKAFNACELILDRNCYTQPEAVALIHRSFSGSREEFTFRDLLEGTARFASGLRDLGICKGDRVFVLLEPSVELYWAILGAIRIGAIAGPLFSAFGTAGLLDRLSDSGARVLVIAAPHLHKIRAIIDQLPQLEHVLVVGEGPLGDRESSLVQLMQQAKTTEPAEPMLPDDPMILHYSSGTTGKPKGVLHAHRALLGHAITAKLVLDLQSDDIYWCTADPGWVTGTSYGIFGPWANSITQISYTGGFSTDAWYQILAEEGVTVWYTSPTALRMLMREGVEATRKHDLTSLRHICSVGEPLNPEVIRWAQEAFGLTVHDTWWQTETGCIQIANYPFMEVRPGSMGRPYPGVTATILDPASFEPVSPRSEGLLALRPDSPAMFLTYWGQTERYRERFKKGWYITGDRAWRDEAGYYWFVGRDDDVINTSGHLVGPFEVESALLEHPSVVEAAVFSIPVQDAGVAVAAQVILAGGHEESRELLRELRTLVRRRVGPYAVPRELGVVGNLPRTRSGKIMRRVARAQFLGLPTGDLSALDEE